MIKSLILNNILKKKNVNETYNNSLSQICKIIVDNYNLLWFDEFMRAVPNNLKY